MLLDRLVPGGGSAGGGGGSGGSATPVEAAWSLLQDGDAGSKMATAAAANGLIKAASPAHVPAVVFEAIVSFTPADTLLAVLQTHAALLTKLGESAGAAGTAATSPEAEVLAVLERLCKGQDGVESKLLAICKFLYDSDVVQEDAFVAWAPSEKVASKAKPFIDWLSEADEDSS